MSGIDAVASALAPPLAQLIVHGLIAAASLTIAGAIGGAVYLIEYLRPGPHL
jgi:hypothetical protein